MKASLTFLLAFFLLTGCVNNNLFQLTNLNTRKINDLIDINGDGKSDLLFFNAKYPDSFFEIFNFSGEKIQVGILGNVGDIPVFGDFTGDGYSDYGIFRYAASGNAWNIFDGLTKSILGNRLGEPGDLPVPGDYDGDGKFDFVVYRPHNSGFYGYLSNKNKYLEIHFGITGDMPIPKDYDGDGHADLAVYNKLGGFWSIRESKSGLTTYTKLGGQNYLPIPSDYDGDNRADIAVWNYKNNDIKIIFSRSGQKLKDKIRLKIEEKLRNKKYFPIASDFDGDGKSEIAFWEMDKDTVHFLKIKNDDLESESYTLKMENGSKPLNYYLLNRYIARNEIISPAILYKIYKRRDKLQGDFDGDFIEESAFYNKASNTFSCKLSSSKENNSISFGSIFGEPLVSDFDGDSRNDFALCDVNNKILTYFSSALNTFTTINLDSKIYGEPFAFDIDLDFKSDPIFYDKKTNIFGFLKSSENYNYGEVLLEKNNA